MVVVVNKELCPAHKLIGPACVIDNTGFGLMITVSEARSLSHPFALVCETKYVVFPAIALDNIGVFVLYKTLDALAYHLITFDIELPCTVNGGIVSPWQ